MSFSELVQSGDLDSAKRLLGDPKNLLQQAVESSNLPVVRLLIEAGFGYLPETTKYPVHQEILELVKPYAWKHRTFHQKVSLLEDVSVCPYNDPDFVEEIFEKKEWKKIDYYLWNVVKMGVDVNEDTEEEHPETFKFYQYGTLELIEEKLKDCTEEDKKIFYANFIYHSFENERDARIFIKGIESAEYVSAIQIESISLLCLQTYMKHPLFKKYGRFHHLFDGLRAIWTVWMMLGQKSRCADAPLRIMTFIEGLEPEILEQHKKERNGAILYLFAKRTRRLLNKYGRIWLEKWHVKSADPNGNGLLFRKWKESIPTDYVK